MSAGQSLTTDQFGHWFESARPTYFPLIVTLADDSSFRAGPAACISGGAPIGALRAGALVTPARERRRLARPQAESVGRYALDLLATSLEATAEAGAAVFSRGAAALLTRINAYMRDN